MIHTTPELDPSFKVRPDGLEDAIPTVRILLVEDNGHDRETLVKLLNRRIGEQITLARVEVIAVATLAAGLGQAEIANCTILDLLLPDSDRPCTIGNIGRFRPPVIVTTGDDDPETERQCILAGAEHVFVKGQIHGLCNAVLHCIMKDLLRLNPPQDAPK